MEANGVRGSLEEPKTDLELLLLQHVETVVDVILLVEYHEFTLLFADHRHHALSVVLNVLHRYLLHSGKPHANG